jgi:hypothetical protein
MSVKCITCKGKDKTTTLIVKTARKQTTLQTRTQMGKLYQNVSYDIKCKIISSIQVSKSQYLVNTIIKVLVLKRRGDNTIN